MGQKVLVFESDARFAGELRNELLKLGCSVNVVDDGNTGLQQASTTKPDLILLAIELPRMNGFSVCNKLKKDPSLKDVPLIIMSSESSDETFEQHRKLRTRAEDYVHKPIGFGELLARIQPFVALGPVMAEAGLAPISMGSDALEDEDIVVDNMSSLPPPRDELGALEGTESYAAEGLTQNGALPSNRPGPLPAFTLSEPPGAASVPPVRISEAPSSGGSEELSQALARVRELEAEVDRVRREAEEAMARMSVAPAPGKVSSKEFLDLREQLNKKDKEILSLKENLGKKDKEIVEAREKSLALERASSDLEDKAIQQERAIAEAEEKVESLTADKEQAKKAGEDFKRRAERAQQDADAKTKEAAELKQRVAEETAKREAETAQKLEDAARAQEEALAQASAEADARRAQEVEEAAESAKRTADRERTEAIAQTETKLKAEQDSKLAALHRAQQDELNKLKVEHAGALDAQSKRLEDGRLSALAELRAELESDRDTRVNAAESSANERVAAAESDRDQKVAAVESDRDQKVAAAESDRDQKVAAAQEAASAKVNAAEAAAAERVSAAEAAASAKAASAEATAAAAEAAAAARAAAAEASAAERIAKLEEQTAESVSALEMRMEELDGELGTAKTLLAERETLLNERSATIDTHVDQIAQLTSARDGLDRDIRSLQDRMVVLEADLASTKQSLAETQSELEGKSSALSRATAKIESDKASLDRAKDALAIALAQIEEAENRAG